MKKFISKILLFTAILAFINALGCYIANNIYFKEYQNPSMDFKSYLLSDSHGTPLEQLTQKYGVYNFSAKSESYIDIDRKIKYLIRHSKIDTIYLTADNHTLSPYRETTNNMDRSEYFLTHSDYENYWEFVKQKYLIRNIIFFQSKAVSMVKSYLYANMLNLLKKKNKSLHSEMSEQWASLDETERIKKSNERAKEQFPIGNSPLLQKKLEEIINTCKEQHIVLIGIKFPLTSTYIKACQGKNFGADSVMRKAGIPILDFETSLKDRNDYFENQDHLNSAGAKKFMETWFSNDKQDQEK